MNDFIGTYVCLLSLMFHFHPSQDKFSKQLENIDYRDKYIQNTTNDPCSKCLETFTRLNLVVVLFNPYSLDSFSTLKKSEH